MLSVNTNPTVSVYYKEVFERIAAVIVERYGLELHIGPVHTTYTGEFDGTYIIVDENQDDEIALYVLLHLFGHTVQWNIDPELRALGSADNRGKSDAELLIIKCYEENASRMGIQLLHEVGIYDLDQWVSDWFAADWKFLEHFYRTGISLPYRDTFHFGAPILEPLAIPAFIPGHWAPRWSF